LKRTALRPFSKKRQATFEARRECVRIVIERDGGCVFKRRLIAAAEGLGAGDWLGDFQILRMTWEVVPLFAEQLPVCGGQLDVHEPKHRSQGADPTDPDQCVAICRVHHDFAHAHPRFAKCLHL